MSAISEIYNRAHNILELADILRNISLTTSETKVIITNKIGKYQWTGELSNNTRLEKI